MNVRRVCIIGAGVSGLAAIKSCLEEGLEPVCFEKSEELGGVWLACKPGGEKGALYNGLVTNSSREMMSFSDFPFPEDTPPYIPGPDVIKYYKKYAEHFDLEKCINFRTTILRIEQADNYTATGRWKVKYCQDGGHEKEEIFDAVMLCTGMFSDAVMPSYPGQEKFQGTMIHSKDYRRSDEFANKTVLVIGGSHSAGDIAVETSRTAKQVYMSMRSGAWVVQRSGPGGWPGDLILNRRINFMIPEAIRRKFIAKHLESKINYSNLGLRHERKLFNAVTMINDELPTRILIGKVKTKTGIDHFEESAVVFTDGTRVEDIDAVVCATGYNLKTSIVDNNILHENIAERELYMYVWPPRLQHSTFACIGFTVAVGAHGPCFEMQTRWAARVFKGLNSLPSEDEMMTSVSTMRREMYERYGKHTVLIPPIPYEDKIAKQIGVHPNFSDFILTDPKLAFQTVFGPAAPSSYRLIGPHKWSGARDQVMNIWETNANVTKTRDDPARKSSYPVQVQLFLAMLLFAFIFMFISI